MKKSGTKWMNFNFDSNEDGPKKSVKKPQKATKVKQPRNEVAKRYLDFDFEAKLIPSDPQDLAVHPKKIQEVEIWLQQSTHNAAASFLLVSGPTGSGKSATVRVLCKKLGLAMTEWSNPVEMASEHEWAPTQSQRFAEFLAESKWGSLESSGSRIILVEEFPNAFLRNHGSFHEVLQESCGHKCRVVFICSENNGQSWSEKLFPEELKAKLRIAQINFNPCAPTLMKTALRRAHALVQSHSDLFKTPTATTIEAVIATSMGDIRNALNQFYLVSLLGSSDPQKVLRPTSSNSGGTKRKRTSNGAAKFEGMSRDENLGLFHGLGKVLNPKWTDQNRLSSNIGQIIDEFSSQPGVFAGFLFQNYIKYFGDIEDVCRAAESLSLSQTFLDKWESRHDVFLYSMWVAVLSLMVHNAHKVSKWTQITGPVKVKKRVQCYNVETRSMNVTDMFYCNIIKTKCKTNPVQGAEEDDEDDLEIVWDPA